RRRSGEHGDRGCARSGRDGARIPRRGRSGAARVQRRLGCGARGCRSLESSHRIPRSDRAVTFLDVLDRTPVRELAAFAMRATDLDVSRALSKGSRDLEDFAALIGPAASERIEELARASHALTLQRFGRTVHMYAPMSLSNECL